MPDPLKFQVRLDQVAQHVDVSPGGEIILRGSYTSRHDGSVVDAATTTWPAGAPGGGSVDAGGLLDLDAGGLHVSSRDATTHEIHAIATGKVAPACAAAGVEAPCLAIRTLPQARSRLITAKEWVDSLDGAIVVEVPNPVVPPVDPSVVPYLQGMAAIVGVGLLATLGWVAQRRRARSPAGQLLALANRVRAKLKTADAVLAAPLAPTLDTALRAVRGRRIDASSAEGRRIAEVLRRVELRIDDAHAQARAEEEQEAADELVREVESALEAADEVSAAARRAGYRPQPPR
jgi:hypothetical protein